MGLKLNKREPDIQEFYSPGKLMITGAYAVLHGSLALAVPSLRGQKMKVINDAEDIQWVALDHKGHEWFSATFDPKSLEVKHTTSPAVAARLQSLLLYCFNQNLKLRRGGQFSSQLEFDRTWGLGSSSTLIANLAKWSGSDPFELMRSAFNGSGYDVYVGVENSAIAYRIDATGRPNYQCITWRPGFLDQLHFVYLGHKQDTQEEVEKAKTKKWLTTDLETMSRITNEVMQCDDIQTYTALMHQHESILSAYLSRPSVQQMLFPGYTKMVSSCGAWGGDFVLAVGNNSDMDYFRDLDYNQIFGYRELVNV